MLVFVCYHEEVTSWFICSSSELEKSTYEFKNVKEMVQQNSFHTESEMRELILKMLLITFSHKCGISPPTHNCIHLTTLLLFESSLYNSAFLVFFTNWQLPWLLMETKPRCSVIPTALYYWLSELVIWNQPSEFWHTDKQNPRSVLRLFTCNHNHVF